MATSMRSCKGKKAPSTNKPGGEDAKLLVHLQTLRWPHGFECPGCRFSCSAKGADAAYQQLVLAPRRVPKSFDELRRVRGLIICPLCKKQVSMTSGTMLARTRLPLPVVYRAAGEFLKVPIGVSTATLERNAGLKNHLTARRLIDVFLAAMKPDVADQLAGDVQVEEYGATLGAAGRSIRCRIIVAAEKRKTGETGRIRLLFSYGSSSMYWIPNLSSPITKAARVEVRRGNLESLLRSWKLKPTAIHERGADPLPTCTKVYEQVDAMLRRVHRGALDKDRVQAVLNGFSFRWNHRGKANRGLEDLMAGLLSGQKWPAS